MKGIRGLIISLNREARIIFKAGLNCDGYFDADQLCNQIDNAIDIFEGITKNHAQGLFIFDNAPSHQKRADDALSARKSLRVFYALILLIVRLISLNRS